MADETHCHADGAGPCLAGDCPIAGQGPLAGHLRPCPGATGPQHAETFPRFVLDRWVSGEPSVSLPDFLLARYAEVLELADRAEEHGNDLSVGLLVEQVCADVEAKRAIVERCAPLANIQVRRQTRNLAGDVLRSLALPYADHPDYREEWKP